MSQYTGSYPTTSTSVNPFGSTGTTTTSQTPTPTTIPPLSGVTSRDSQSPSAPSGTNLNIPQTAPQVNQATGGAGTAAPNPTPPTSSVSFTDTSNPYALYSSYNFGSYPTNVQAKSEPLA